MYKSMYLSYVQIYVKFKFNFKPVSVRHFLTLINFTTALNHQLHNSSLLVNMDDPRRIEEFQRRRAGLYRRLGITRTPKPHPRIGGSGGDPLEMRQSEICSHDHGMPAVAS